MPRKNIDIEKSWRFTRMELPGFEHLEFDASNWETVNIPHDWAIKGPFDEGNDKEVDIMNADFGWDPCILPGQTGALPHVGRGFYRKEIILPDSFMSSTARLEIDGIMSNSLVYCNGKLLGGRPYGYSSFSLDLSEVLRAGRNIIAISAENLPASSRWYPGAGIYRHIRLIILEDVHIDHWGIRVTTEKNKVKIKTAVNNKGKKEKIELVTEIFDKNNLLCADTQTAFTDKSHQFDSELLIPEAKFWTPKKPFLYRVISTIKLNGKNMDQVETVFGLRDIAFDSREGFSINGEKMHFNGVCMHHDLGPLGAAVNTAAWSRQLSILKTMGCNAIRTVHNPPAPDFLDLCDEMGFLVIDEAFDEWKEQKSPNGYHLYFENWWERDLRDMIRRDANHPSIIMWSIGNEITEQCMPYGTELAKSLCAICHDEDSTRPTTAGLNDMYDTVTGGLFEAVDIHGFNYKPYIYSIYHHRHPERILFASESASTVSTRDEYTFPLFEGVRKQENLQVGSFDLAHTPGGTLPDHEFKGQDENPYVMGEFVWTGFDYLGEPAPYREEWPARSSYYGIVDLCGLPKDRFYLYQSRWTDQDVLHLMPHWTWPGSEGEILAVQCYSNSPQVELFVNGVSMGLQKKNPKSFLRRYRFIWEQVIYEPGELKAVAMDKKNNIVNEKIIYTSGQPAKIKLTSDRNIICNDGKDMVFVTVEIIDNNGNHCPFADKTVIFSTDGPVEIAAVCNGDPTSLEDFTSDRIKAFHGKCVAYLRSVPTSSNNNENINITAQYCSNNKNFESKLKIRTTEDI